MAHSLIARSFARASVCSAAHSRVDSAPRALCPPSDLPAPGFAFPPTLPPSVWRGIHVIIWTVVCPHPHPTPSPLQLQTVLSRFDGSRSSRLKMTLEANCRDAGKGHGIGPGIQQMWVPALSRSKLFGGGERGRGRSLSVFAECIRSRQGVNSAFPIADKTQRACALQTKYTRTCTYACAHTHTHP